jgi:glycosyltransferase involved in cell wall biosynthesis/polysaccharide pyruvyl transferase WcaK-like protein
VTGTASHAAPDDPARHWAARSPRVLVTDAWLANAGDALIAVALERLLRELVPNAAVLHAAYQWDEFGPRIPALNAVPPLEALLGTPWAPPIAGYERAGAALVEEADAIVCQGGGFLVESYAPIARVAALADIVRREKPLAVVGVALGRFAEPRTRRELETVLGRAALVVVRDRVSLAHAREAGCPAPVLGADLALAAFSRRPSTNARHGVSLVLTDHHPHAARRSARAAVARALLETVLETAPDEPIHLWSTVQGAPGSAREDDAVLAARLVADLPRAARSRITVEEGPMTPARAVELARERRALVSMRVHPALMAAGSGVPWALVLADDRLHPFDDALVGARVARDSEPARAVDVIRAALADEPSPAVYEELAPLRARLSVTTTALSTFLRTAAPGGRQVRLRTRARHVVQRGTGAVRLAARSAAGALPHRALGAVQGPVRTRPGVRRVWGWARAHDDDRIVTVLVTHDGAAVLAAELGAPPPDVVAAFEGSDGVLVGWSASVPFAPHASRTSLAAVAVCATGRMLPLTPLTVDVDVEVVGEIDVPALDTEVLPGPLRITGIVQPGAPLARVEIAVDGTRQGRARLCSHDDPTGVHTTALTGFEHTVLLAPDAPTRTVVVTARAVTLDGGVHRCGELAVQVAGSDAPANAPLALTAVRRAERASRYGNGRGERRRVGVFTHSLELGGAQLWLHEVVRHLRARGDQYTVVAGRDGPLRAELEADGVPVRVCDAVLLPPGTSREAPLVELCRDLELDVSLVNTVVASAAADALLRVHVPVVWAIHEHIPPELVWSAADGHDDGATSEYFLSLLRASQRLLFVCAATRDLYAAAIDDGSSSIVVPYGVSVADLDRYTTEHPAARDRSRRHLGVGPTDLLIASVGTIEPRKAQAALVHALAALARDLPDAHVVLVGDTGTEYARSVARLAQQLGVARRVHLVGSTREPEPWLLAADVFVMASDLESMPRAAMEAMAYRLPVVLGDVGGCAELLGFGEFGRVVAPRDVQSLADALQELGTSSTLRAELGAAARGALVLRHGDLSYAGRVADVLDDVGRDEASRPHSAPARG